MTCSSCKNLKEKKSAKGSVGGCKYFCSKFKTYVTGDTDKCEKYEKDYGRNNLKCDKIFKEGREYYNDDRSVGFYVTILIVIIIIAIILKLSGY